MPCRSCLLVYHLHCPSRRDARRMSAIRSCLSSRTLGLRRDEHDGLKKAWYISSALSFRPKARLSSSKFIMSLTTPVYPGIDLDANDGPRMNAVAIAFIVLTFVTLVFRFISRLSTHVPIGLDDYLIVIAAVRLQKRRPISCTGYWRASSRSFPGATPPQWLSRLSTTTTASTLENLIRITSKNLIKGYMAWLLYTPSLLHSVNCHFWRYTGVSLEWQVRDFLCK